MSSLPPSGQAIKLYCQAEHDHSEFIRAFHVDSERATEIFSKECLSELIHGLWLLIHTCRLDILQDEESPAPVQLEITTNA